MIKERIKNKLAEFIRLQVGLLIENYTNILKDISETERQIKELRDNMSVISENIRNINAIVPDKTDALSNDMEMIAVNVRSLNKQTEYMESTLDRLSRKMQRLNTGEQKTEQNLSTEIKSSVQVGQKEDSYTAIDYFDFENHFRGSRDEIKQRQKQYLPYFENCKNIVDLGCGRGEFLELLKENEIPATGVDFYEEYVDYCQEAGLTAVCDDAIHYLYENNNLLDGIFVGQVIEHLTVNQIVDLCNLSYEKLEKDGVVIFETPNPTSLATYTHAFYLDPSHTKPVHPLTMQYFLQKAGFKQIEILYTDSSKIDVHIPDIRTEENEEAFNLVMKEVEKLLFGSQDYAIVARK